MARRVLTVDRHEEIKRRLADGRSLREIATALGCSRRLVRQIRDGERLTHETAPSPDPLWMSQLEWPVIIHELRLGFPMKFIWEERAKELISYPNFWKQFYRKFLQYREATITAREFESEAARNAKEAMRVPIGIGFCEILLRIMGMRDPRMFLYPRRFLCLLCRQPMRS
jgi:transcriptional regulator with XRE-family HTH domain